MACRSLSTASFIKSCDQTLLFTSDDDSVKAYVSHSSLEASLYVKETDYSVIGPEGAYTFSNKY